MDRQKADLDELVFVIETCQNCRDHGWNTRHDEQKYLDFFNKLSGAIIERLPNAVTMRNQIPKSYLPYDLYLNLVPNDDDSIPYFQQVPRTGSFEVSYKGLLIFSKLNSGLWPNIELVATKCQMIVTDEAEGKDVSQYLAGANPLSGESTKKPTQRRTNASSKKASHQKPQQSYKPQEYQEQYVPQQIQQQPQIQEQQPMQMQQQPEQNQMVQQTEPEDKFVHDQSKKTIDPKAQPQVQPTVQQQVEQKQVVEQQQQLQEQPMEEPVKLSKLDQEIEDYFAESTNPSFKGSNSLLKQSLSRKYYDQMRDSVDEFGFSFKKAIYSGCKNLDSGVGVYAGSHDSYYKWHELFDQVIEKYHGHGKDDKHKSDMNADNVNAPEFPEHESKMIKSTRIRVGRNLKDYPLGPGLSKEQRLEVNEKIVTALKSFTGDLAGTYYDLGSMNDKQRQQLIDDHFLFKEGDRFLECCGLNREWPEGRGIFHNDAKTFLVWVNEEDQLRIISMQQGSNIKEVFSRLSRACSHIETVAKFSHDDHLGYITSCPSNLGTALRASVHIHLPNLGQDKQLFESIADKYNVQIRGAHGEHSETDDHIYDISNKRRLGLSEVQLVQDMYDGVKAMIQKETELTPKVAETEVQAGSHLKKPEDLTGFINFPEGTKSLLCKYLTKEIWDKYKNESDVHGFTFKQAILSGAQNVDSGIGVYAGSHSSYVSFADMFDKIIEDYHQHSKEAVHKSNMDHSQLNRDPFSPEEEALVLSTRVRVGRNLADYPLGPGVTREQRNEIESKVTQALSNMEGDLKGQYYSLSSMTDEQRKQLIEDHFLFKEGDRFLEACGLNRDWPEGRGIFHNDAKTFLVWVNEEDQLRIISMQKGAGLLEVFVRLSKACKAIEDVAKFAHDDHLGYITSCPTNLGTALRASVHIQLPLLGCQKDKFQAIADKYYVQIRGAHGEHTETDDHIYDISNKRRLGRGEVELVQDMYDGVKEMMAVELALQKEKAEKEAEEERKRKEAEAEEEAKKKAAAEEEEKKKQEAEQQQNSEKVEEKQEEKQEEKVEEKQEEKKEEEQQQSEEKKE